MLDRIPPQGELRAGAWRVSVKAAVMVDCRADGMPLSMQKSMRSK